MKKPPDALAGSMQVGYELLFEFNPLPMWVYDASSLCMLAVNAAALEKYGYSKDEFVCLSLLDLHAEEDHPRLKDMACMAMNEQSPEALWRHRQRSGKAIEVETHTREFKVGGQRVRMTVVRDVSELHRAEEAQRELATQLTETLESISDAFFTLDRQGCFTYFNARAEALFQLNRKDVLGRSGFDVFPQVAGTVFEKEARRALAEQVRVNFTAFLKPQQLWVEQDIYPKPNGLTVYLRDVTVREHAARQLREQHDALSAIVNATSDAIIAIDGEGLIIMFSSGAERIFQRTAQSMMGQPLSVLLPERFRAGHRAHVRRFEASGDQARMMGLGMVKGLLSDGQEIDLEGTISRSSIDGVSALIVCMRDVTERVRARVQSDRNLSQLTELTKRLMGQERTMVKRLAQALHDQLGQTLAALRMLNETVVTAKEEELPGGRSRLDQQMGTLIGQAIRQIRQVLMDLRPPLLEENGLAAALDNELRNRSLTKPEVDISICVSAEVAALRWPAEVEYAAFMVTREAVENALRHAQAGSIAVHLSGRALAMQLEITDDGVGYVPRKAASPGHLGILGMEERAHACGANLTVSARESGGTRVSFTWQASE